MQNACIERLNKHFRGEVSIIAEDWRPDYNRNYPHKALGRISLE